MIGPKEKIFARADPEFWPGRPRIGQILGFWAPLATRGLPVAVGTIISVGTII